MFTCIRITWKTPSDKLLRPTPQFQIQSVWHGGHRIYISSSSQGIQLLLVRGPHFSNHVAKIWTRLLATWCPLHTNLQNSEIGSQGPARPTSWGHSWNAHASSHLTNPPGRSYSDNSTLQFDSLGLIGRTILTWSPEKVFQRHSWQTVRGWSPQNHRCLSTPIIQL